MLKKILISNILFATVASHAQAPLIQPPCSILPQVPTTSAVFVTTKANTDMGYLISNAVAQAVANGSNTVIVNNGGSAPMVTPVVLNNLSNFTIQMNPGTNIWGYDLSQPMFVINGGFNVKITGGSLYAGNTGTNAPSCIGIVGTDALPVNGVELSGFECSGSSSHGIVVNGSGSTPSSFKNVQNVTIHNTLVHDTGSLNIYGSGVTNMCMQNNILVNPAIGGINGNGTPSNVGISYAENVYFGQNYVAGTPTFYREPEATNTPPSGFYAYASMNVYTDTNTFANSQCTVATCSGTTDLPSSPSAIHDDSVLNAININNEISSYGPGITCEVSWSCNVIGGSIHDIYAYALYDQSRFAEQGVNTLTSTAGLAQGLPSVSLQTVGDVVNGVPTSVVQATVRAAGPVFSQNLSYVMNDGPLPFPEIWIKSANGQPADTYELWFSGDTNIAHTHNKMAFPALPAGQWTRVALQPSHLGMMGLIGVRSWALVNTTSNTDTISVSDYRQIADSRNNVYYAVNIARTGAYPLEASGCGSATTFANNTITDPGTTGIWPYTNTGLIGQVLIGWDPYCTRSGVYFNSNYSNLNSSAIPMAGSSLFNVSNYGLDNMINGIYFNRNIGGGRYGGAAGTMSINNQGINSTIVSPTVISY